MQNKFRQPVSMQVTKEQYEKDLREPLLRMGYEEVAMEKWEHYHILVTNLANIDYQMSNTQGLDKKLYNRYFIDHYNPKLFLAIAAMTDGEFPIVGEWVVYTDSFCEMFGLKAGKLYRTNESNANPRYLRRATLQELITNFTKQENIMKKEITTELIEELKNLIAPENEEQFNKLMGIEKPMFKKEDFRFGDKVWLRNGDMLFVILEWNTSRGTKEEFGLFNEFGAIEASHYSSTLLHKDNKLADIMTVYRPNGNYIPDDLINSCLEDYTLIWSRE